MSEPDAGKIKAPGFRQDINKKIEAGAGAQARLRARLDKSQTTNGSSAFGRATACF